MPPIWRGQELLYDMPDSPAWEFGERVSMVRTLRGPYDLAISSAPLRGAIGTGTASGLRVARSTVTRERGGVGILQIEFEHLPGSPPAQGAQLPNDDARMDWQPEPRPIETHPRYASVSQSLLDDINTVLKASTETQDYKQAKIRVDASTLALELKEKLRRDVVYTIWTPTYILTSYYWTLPGSINGVTFRQSPPSFPIVPPSGNDWLRTPDRTAFDGTYWRVESTWIGAPDLDTDLWPVA